MKLHHVEPRPNVIQTLESLGFSWHTMYGHPYWDESRYYSFELDEIENKIEDVSDALVSMCYDAVEYVTKNPLMMRRFRIPEKYQAYVAESWFNQERDLYGRFDLCYDGVGDAKLLEFNADTPTGLFESAVVQWQWLEEQKTRGVLPSNADQFNSVHERLIEGFRNMGLDSLYFTGVLDNEEDSGTLAYLQDCAAQAGIVVSRIDISDIGHDYYNNFTDLNNYIIQNLFKLYPWEDLFKEEYGDKLLHQRCRMIEPAWKSILSNKALLPLLWEMFPDHPNLLPAFFEDDPKAQTLDYYARKPIFSREGANIQLRTPDGDVAGEDQQYGAEGYIRQKLAMLPKFGDSYAVIGSWIVAGGAAGMAIREDHSPITQNLSRFIPHIIT